MKSKESEKENNLKKVMGIITKYYKEIWELRE